MIKVSVCLATYNGERFILRQLISILDQLSENDEIIVSDDGSNDKTLSIINQINDSRIKVFNNRNRKGIVGNFENALVQASGEYIFLADQDDIWLPGKVSEICDILLYSDLVLTDCEMVDELGAVKQESFFKYRRSRKGFWANLYRNSYIGCCMAFRKEILSYILPFPKYIDVHDWWIGLLVELKGRVTFYNKPLIKYVRHGNNASPTGEDGYGILIRLKNRFHLLVSVVKRLLL